MAVPDNQSPDPLTDKPPYCKLRWAIGLKIFAGILLVLGAASGWVIWRGYRQLAAIELIERSNVGRMAGRVKCEPVGPDWLRKQLGNERMRMFDRVTEVGCFLESPNPELFREVGRWSDVTTLTFFFGSLDESEPQSPPTFADMRQFLSAKAEMYRETETGFKHLHNLTRLKLLCFQGRMVTDRDLEWIGRQSDLTHLIFEFAPITDQTTRHFRKLNKLEFLRLPGTLITDEGLVHLRELRSLNILDLTGTAITDEGLVHLENLTDLVMLHLSGTDISGEGLIHLQNLPKLTRLSLRFTSVTNANLMHVVQLSGLQELDLDIKEIDDEGLLHIGKLKNLKYLNLIQSRITDAGLEHLHGMTNLEQLDLNGTAITDAGLIHLKSLTNLKNLLVNDTKVTSAGVEELELALPRLLVSPSSSLLFMQRK